jgi:hypothetical protein
MRLITQGSKKAAENDFMFQILPTFCNPTNNLLIIRANEIVIENSKTGKMSAVVVILKVFGDKFTDSRSANPRIATVVQCL